MTDENVVEEAPKPLVIKPGFMVSLRTYVVGGVHRKSKPLPVNQVVPETSEVTRSEVEITVVDKAEHERAEKVRDKARYCIAKLCEETRFGLISPPEAEKDLKAAIKESRLMARAHNATAKHSFVRVDVLCAMISSSDEEAVRTFSEEMRRILDEMTEAIKVADVKAIRAAVSQAKAMKKMIGGEHANKVSLAIAQAREVANAQAKAIRAAEERGESAEQAVMLAQTDQVLSARAAFLVAEEDGEAVEEAVPVPAARALQADESGEDGDAEDGGGEAGGGAMAAEGST